MKKTYLLLSAIIICLSLHAQVITTIIGNGTMGSTGDGGPATAATIDAPVRAVIDKAGNIYIAEPNYNIIRVVNKAGIISHFGGTGAPAFGGDGGPASAAQFNYPSDLCLDDSGNLYVMDAANYRVRKINTAGIVTTIGGNGTNGNTGDGGPAISGEIGCGGINVDATGNLYIAQSYKSTIREISKAGILSTFAGNGQIGYSGDGGPATAAEFNSPEAMVVDNSGNMYIADVGNNCIRKIDNTGIVTTIAGNGLAGYSGDNGPATAAQLYYPTGIAFDSAGHIYIADSYNNCIRKIDNTGTITTIAGNGLAGYSGDGGPATAAQLNAPVNITLDSVGNMYIADYYNYAVRKVDNAYLLSINNIQANTNSAVYPNPNRGAFMLQVNSDKRIVNSVVEIYTTLGEKVYSKQLTMNNGQLTMNLNDEPSGVYLYKIVSGNGNTLSAGKFVIEK